MHRLREKRKKREKKEIRGNQAGKMESQVEQKERKNKVKKNVIMQEGNTYEKEIKSLLRRKCGKCENRIL